jgi:hypothetical protein
MFFYIGNDCPLLEQVSDRLFLDKGWKQIAYRDVQVWYKGYVTTGSIEQSLEQIIEGYQPEGIWTVITYKDIYKIHHPVLRGFPLYKKDDELTNLSIFGFEFIENHKLNTELKEHSIEVATSIVLNTLLHDCENFYKVNQQPLEIYASGGFDTTSIIAACEYASIPYRIYIPSLGERSSDFRMNSGTVNEQSSLLIEFCRENYWAYKFMSIYKDKQLMTCGYYGDEILCRNIWQLNKIANAKSLTLRQILKETDYLYQFINRKDHQYLLDAFQSQPKFKEDLTIGVGNQVWHINETITFCPYFNSAILKACLGLSVDDLLTVGPNALIQKSVIEQCNTEILCLLDEYKNTKDTTKNFFANYRSINLKHCTEIVLT